MNIVVPAQFTHIIDTNGNAVRPTPVDIGEGKIWVDWGYVDEIIPTPVDIGDSKNWLDWGYPDEIVPTITTYDTGGKIVEWGISEEIIIAMVEIGIWDMVTNPNVTVQLPAGATYTNVAMMDAIIFRDDGVNVQHLTKASSASDGTMQGWVSAIGSTGTVTLSRLTGGIFDGAAFDDNSINRGYLFIVYKKAP